MASWLFKFNQPRGFDALREETNDFTQLASHPRVTAEPGDRRLIYPIEGMHVVAVVRTTGTAFQRQEDGAHADRRRYAVPTVPELVSTRGPKVPVAGRNFRRLSEDEFRELVKVVRLNRH